MTDSNGLLYLLNSAGNGLQEAEGYIANQTELITKQAELIEQLEAQVAEVTAERDEARAQLADPTEDTEPAAGEPVTVPDPEVSSTD